VQGKAFLFLRPGMAMLRLDKSVCGVGAYNPKG
jgi:hypothetical protein